MWQCKLFSQGNVMHFWAEEKYEVCQLLLLRGMIATQQLAEEEEKDIKEEGQASSNTFSRYENLFFKIQMTFSCGSERIQESRKHHEGALLFLAMLPEGSWSTPTMSRYCWPWDKEGMIATYHISWAPLNLPQEGNIVPMNVLDPEKGLEAEIFAEENRRSNASGRFVSLLWSRSWRWNAATAFQNLK